MLGYKLIFTVRHLSFLASFLSLGAFACKSLDSSEQFQSASRNTFDSEERWGGILFTPKLNFLSSLYVNPSQAEIINQLKTIEPEKHIGLTIPSGKDKRAVDYLQKMADQIFAEMIRVVVPANSSWKNTPTAISSPRILVKRHSEKDLISASAVAVLGEGKSGLKTKIKPPSDVAAVGIFPSPETFQWISPLQKADLVALPVSNFKTDLIASYNSALRRKATVVEYETLSKDPNLGMEVTYWNKTAEIAAHAIPAELNNIALYTFVQTPFIVIYDTLIGQLTASEAYFVLAHEIAHYIMGHALLPLSNFRNILYRIEPTGDARGSRVKSLSDKDLEVFEQDIAWLSRQGNSLVEYKGFRRLKIPGYYTEAYHIYSEATKAASQRSLNPLKKLPCLRFFKTFRHLSYRVVSRAKKSSMQESFDLLEKHYEKAKKRCFDAEFSRSELLAIESKLSQNSFNELSRLLQTADSYSVSEIWNALYRSQILWSNKKSSIERRLFFAGIHKYSEEQHADEIASVLTYRKFKTLNPMIKVIEKLDQQSAYSEGGVPFATCLKQLQHMFPKNWSGVNQFAGRTLAPYHTSCYRLFTVFQQVKRYFAVEAPITTRPPMDTVYRRLRKTWVHKSRWRKSDFIDSQDYRDLQNL